MLLGAVADSAENDVKSWTPPGVVGAEAPFPGPDPWKGILRGLTMLADAVELYCWSK